VNIGLLIAFPLDEFPLPVELLAGYIITHGFPPLPV
jgi:hypothetical protein